MKCKNREREVVLNFSEKDISIKISILKEDIVEKVKKKIENILGVDLNNLYDLYIKNFNIGDVFDKLEMEELLQEFKSNDIDINKKLLLPMKKDKQKTNLEIGVYTNLNPAIIPTKQYKPLRDELAFKELLLMNYEQTDRDLLSTLEELILLESNLREYNDSLVLPNNKSSNNTLIKNDTLSLTSLLNKEDSQDTEDTFNSKEKFFTKCLDKFLVVQYEKDSELKSKTDKLLFYKQLEKRSFNICKDNEILSGELDSLEKMKENRINLIEKLSYKEGKLYDKLAKDSMLLYKYMIDKNKMDNNYYFQKLKLYYCRAVKEKYMIKLVDETKILIFRVNYKNPKDSELLFRKFKDKCNFFNYFREKLERRNELQLNLKKKLIIVFNKESYIYNLKTNEMRVLALSALNDYHVNGNLLYVPYDNSIYCISGRYSYSVEKLKLPNLKCNFYNLSEKWSSVCILENTRAYFCSFVINKKIIYNILGFNYLLNEHCIDIVKIDVSLSTPTSISIKVAESHSPKLTLSSCLKFMDQNVYIIGGMYNEREKNPNVFMFDTSKNIFIKTEFMIKPNYELYETINFNINLSSMATTNFLNEINFTPIKFDLNYEENSFFYCLFDTGHFLHLINVKSLKHFMICQDNKDEMWDEDSDEEDIEKSKTNSESRISENFKNKHKHTIEYDEDYSVHCIEESNDQGNEGINNSHNSHSSANSEINFKKTSLQHLNSTERIRVRNFINSSSDDNQNVLVNEGNLINNNTLNLPGISKDINKDTIISNFTIENEGDFNIKINR